MFHVTQRYLRQRFQAPSRNAIWTLEDSDNLLQMLQRDFTQQDIDNQKEEIKEAFIDYFQNVGKSIFRFSRGQGIQYRLVPYTLQPEDSQIRKKLIDYILEHKDQILYPYKGKNDQMYINSDLKHALEDKINKSTEPIDPKALLVFVIKKALKLSERDIVLVKRDDIIVKVFNTVNELDSSIASPKDKKSGEDRFKGYDQKEIEAHLASIFNSKELAGFITSSINELSAEQLNFSEISNAFFEQNELRIIRNHIAHNLSLNLIGEEEYLIGMAGYIFRQHFVDVHQQLAEALMEKVVHKDTHAKEFLFYYSGDVVVEKGKKYKIPALATLDGRTWLPKTTIPIFTTWIKNNKVLHSITQEHQQLAPTYTNLKSAVEKTKKTMKVYQATLNNYQDKHKQAMRDRDRYINKLEESLSKQESRNEYTRIRENVHNLKQHVNMLAQKINEQKEQMHQYKLQNNALITEFKTIESQRQKLYYEMKTIQKNININSTAYHSIIHSLTYALTQRKKPL
jgi:hypothetical protein